MPPPKLDFDKVFAESSPFVWRLLSRLGVATADLPDVCQEVFVIVYRRLGDYDGRASVRAWISGISTRLAADYRRRAHRRYETLGGPPLEAAAPADQQRQLELGRTRARLRQVLSELDDGKRDVFVLYELEELSMKEVAEIVDCTLKTAYARLYAARKAVALAFGATFADIEPS
ncbi:MAG TPA: RNA polymerase sigma factor [Polyangiaceae bacterium]